MKRSIEKTIALFVSLIIAFSFLSTVFVYASFNTGANNAKTAEQNNTEEYVDKKVYSEATILDDFADDSILIVLSKKETFMFKNYSKDDFIGVEIAEVDNLSLSMAETIQSKISFESGIQITKKERIIDSNSFNAKDSYGSDLEDLNEVDLFEELTESKIKNFRSILYIKLQKKGKQNVLDAIRVLEKDDRFLYVGPNHFVYTSSTPNDPFYSDQWGLPKINAPAAWNERTNASPIVQVGVVDTGIQGNHPDLENELYPYRHRDFTTGVTAGVEVNVGNLTDPNGHGTHVAGIIGAQGNNGIGVAGVCWSIKLISLRALDSDGQGQTSQLINAINYAQNNYIRILNMSLGSYTYNAALETAIRNYTGLIVAAAGNENENTDNTPFYPASFTNILDNVISVGASDANDNRSNWNGFQNLWGYLGQAQSNYGKTTVDVFAPGSDIYSTLKNGSYGNMSGTSMATPFVSGVVALIKSINNSFQPSDIKHIINYTADQITELSDLCVSGGRLNAAAALNAALHTESISISANTRYTERKTTLDALDYKEYIVTCEYSGNRIIQTFGSSQNQFFDSYLIIFDMNGTILASDSNSGYGTNALTSCYFQENTSYRIRIGSLLQPPGDIRLAIIPTYSYSDYEDFYSLTDYTMGLTWDFSQYSVKVATYTFTTTTELVMRLSSEVDTFLYIIDPRSSEYCYEIEDIDDLYADLYPSLCNDNYFVDFTYTSNSRIRKTFDANVPYLIVFCAYNPSSPSSVGSFYVDFE